MNAFKFTDVDYVATIPFDQTDQGYDYVSALPPSARNVVVNTAKVTDPKVSAGRAWTTVSALLCWIVREKAVG